MGEASNIKGWIARGGMSQDRINLTLAEEIDKLKDKERLLDEFVQAFSSGAVKIFAGPETYILLTTDGEISIRGKKVDIRGSEEIYINTLGKLFINGALYRS